MKLELQNQGMKENQIRLSCEEIMNGCMAANVNCSTIKDSDDSSDSIRVPVAPSSKKLSDSYVDKTVMECQLSKTVVCYKEINVNDVKDICIDEGVSSVDKIFSGSKDEKPICRIPPREEDNNGGFIKQRNSEVPKSKVDDGIPSVENPFVKDWTACDDFRDLARIGEEKFDMADPNPPTREVVGENYSSKTFKNDGNKVEKTGVQILGEKAKSEDPASASKAVESCNGNSAPGFDAKSPSDNNLTSETALAFNNEVENGSINFNSLSLEASDEEHHASTATARSTATEERCRNSDSAVETQVSTAAAVGTSNTQLFSTHTQYDTGESSFSVADPLASLVTYSGPIAYSGNVSLRSESSAASTRSFAFPILQSEWNSSPVKMVKADRRHYRKYRGWREGLLCCRF